MNTWPDLAQVSLDRAEPSRAKSDSCLKNVPGTNKPLTRRRRYRNIHRVHPVGSRAQIRLIDPTSGLRFPRPKCLQAQELVWFLESTEI